MTEQLGRQFLDDIIAALNALLQIVDNPEIEEYPELLTIRDELDNRGITVRLDAILVGLLNGRRKAEETAQCAAESAPTQKGIKRCPLKH